MMRYLLFAFVLICNGACFAQNLPDYVPQNGLVAWWPFSGNAADSSGNSNNGTAYNASLTSDRFGNPSHAYSFNGSSSYISVLSSSSLESPVTRLSISAWVNLAGIGPFAPVLCKSNAATNSFMYNFGLLLTYVFTEINNFNAPLKGPYNFSLNQWYMITVVLDSSTAAFYVNGALINTQPYVTNIVRDTRPLVIGADPPGSWEYYNGKIDDIGIWNRALTACEVRQLYYADIMSITVQPAGHTITNGNAGIFTAGSADSCVSYQWQQNTGSGFTDLANGGIYTGADQDSLIINPVTTDMNNYNYRCIISSCLFCADTTNEAVLNVTYAPPCCFF